MFLRLQIKCFVKNNNDDDLFWINLWIVLVRVLLVETTEVDQMRI